MCEQNTIVYHSCLGRGRVCQRSCFFRIYGVPIFFVLRGCQIIVSAIVPFHPRFIGYRLLDSVFLCTFFLLFLFVAQCIFFICCVVYLVLIFISKVSFFFASLFYSNPLACWSVFAVFEFGFGILPYLFSELGIKTEHYNSFLLRNTFLFSVIAVSMMHIVFCQRDSESVQRFYGVRMDHNVCALHLRSTEKGSAGEFQVLSIWAK